MSNKEFPMSKLALLIVAQMNLGIQPQQFPSPELIWTLEIPCWILDIP